MRSKRKRELERILDQYDLDHASQTRSGRAGSPGGREVGPGLLRRCRERGGAEALPFVYGATLGSQISSGWPSETGSPVKALTREEVRLRSSR
jgi:hypothetical protein